MHAFLLIGKNKDLLSKNIELIAEEKKSRILRNTLEKIEDVRELSGLLKLSQKEPLTIVVENIDKATPEALNSFLKNLEEPAKNITFILTSEHEHAVLPTISSRCQIISIGGQRETSDTWNEEKLEAFLKGACGEKLSLVSSIKSRDDAKAFLEHLIYKLHKKLLKEGGSKSRNAKFLQISEEAFNRVNLNGNVSLQLTSMVVKLENI